MQTVPRAVGQSPTRACRGGTAPRRIDPAMPARHRHTSSDLETPEHGGKPAAVLAGSTPAGHGPASNPGQLIKDWTEMVRQRLHAAEQTLQGFFRILQPFTCVRKRLAFIAYA